MFARRFGDLEQTRWAVYSMIMGIVFFAVFFGIATGTQLGVALSNISPADGNALAKDVLFSACCLQDLYCKIINLPRNEKPREVDC